MANDLEPAERLDVLRSRVEFICARHRVQLRALRRDRRVMTEQERRRHLRRVAELDQIRAEVRDLAPLLAEENRG